jgi:hypothetical protein
MGVTKCPTQACTIPPRRCVSRLAPTRITAHGTMPCQDLRIFNIVMGSKWTLIRGTRTPALSSAHRRNRLRQSSLFLFLLFLLLLLLFPFRPPPLPRRLRLESGSLSRPQKERGGCPFSSSSSSPDALRSISPFRQHPLLLPSLEQLRKKWQ